MKEREGEGGREAAAFNKPRGGDVRRELAAAGVSSSSSEPRQGDSAEDPNAETGSHACTMSRYTDPYAALGRAEYS